MRRLIHPVWLLGIGLGVTAAVFRGILGGGGGEDRSSVPGAASIDTGDVSLQGAGLLTEGERSRPRERPLDVVKPAPAVSSDPARLGEAVGQVVDADGRPVVAMVSLYLDGAGYGPYSSATTDAAGRFRIRPRSHGPAEWTGVVALVRPLGFTAPLTPTRAGADPLRIVATRAREARIRVVDETGTGVGIARVRAGAAVEWTSMRFSRPWIDRAEELASWLGRDTYTDRAGIALVMQPPTPTSVVTVTGPLDRDLLPARLVGWDGGDATVRMTAKPRVEGTVRESDGSLLTEGKVWWRRSGTDEWKEVRVEYDGTFSIDCGVPGAIELCPLMYNAFPRPPVPSRVVPSGATNVALLTEAGPTLDVRLGGWMEEAMGTAVLIREPADETDAPRIAVKIDDGRVLVRGLDPAAKYTLWVPPLSRTTATPMEVEPGTRSVLRSGLAASAEPLVVPLTPVHEVHVRFASAAQTHPWSEVRITVRGQGALLELPFYGSRQFDESSYEGEAVLPLPAGSYRVRLEAIQYVSTDAELAANRILVRAYAGEVDLETGTERVDVVMKPTSDGPVERAED